MDWLYFWKKAGGKFLTVVTKIKIKIKPFFKMAQSIMNTLYIAIQPSNTAAHSKMDFKAFISTYKKEGVGQTHVNLSLWSTLAWFSAQIGGRHSDWRRSSKRRPHYYYIQYCALCSMASKLFNTCLKFLLCADNFLINLTWWSSWNNPLCLAKFSTKMKSNSAQKSTTT